MRRTPYLLLVALLATACAQFQAEPTAPGASLTADTTGMAVLVPDLQRWPADWLDFHDVRIIGDTLVARVSFAGGCREHRFALAFADVFMESYPVQVGGLLSHDAHGDPCRALISPTLRYDLSPLRDAYRAAYRQESGTIVLQGNWPGALHYRF